MRTFKAPSVLLVVGAALVGRTVFGASKVNDIKISFDAELKNPDPRYLTDANSHYLSDLTNCSLINFDKDGNIIGQLAESWKWLTPTKIEFKLKQGAKFKDGSNVKSEDVKATFAFFSDSKITPASPLQPTMQNIVAIEAKNDLITFELKTKDVSFLQNFVIGILPAALAGKPLADIKSHVGCGPYTLVDYSLNKIELEANKNFSLGPVAKNNIQIYITKDENSRFMKLQKGELHLVQNGLSPDNLKLILSKFTKKMTLMQTEGLNTTYIGFNFKNKFLANLDVRRAISLSVNREAIIKHVLQGYARPADTILTEKSLFYIPSIKQNTKDFDLAQAKTILDKAGFKDPDGDGPLPRFALSYKTTTSQTRLNIARVIASDLRKIGIEVDVVSQEWGKFKQDVEQGLVDIWGLQWTGFKDPDVLTYAFHSRNFPPAGPNRGYFKNQGLDTILDAAREETVFEKRKELYKKAQETLNSELPYFILWHEPVIAVVTKKLKGFVPYADGRLSSLAQVSLD